MKFMYQKSTINKALSFYLENKNVDFDKTAKFISTPEKKYKTRDIGKMFQYVVVLGKDDNTSLKLAYEINLRNTHANPYEKFLLWREIYLERLDQVTLLEEMFEKAKMYEELCFEDFESSEDEEFFKMQKEELRKYYDMYTSYDMDEYYNIIHELESIYSKFNVLL